MAVIRNYYYQKAYNEVVTKLTTKKAVLMTDLSFTGQQ